MSFGSARVRLVAVAWLLLVGAAVAIGVTGEQNDLGTSAETALAEAGLDVAVEVAGRDVTLQGNVSDRVQAETLVSAIDGVRVVNWKDTESAATAAASTTTTNPPETTSPPTTVASTLPPIDNGANTSDAARIDARLESGQLTVRGAIPDAEAATRLAGVADLIYAPLLDNQLEVDPEIETASWVPGVANAIAVLPILGTSGLSIEGNEATVFGFAPTPERLAQFEGALAQALGPDVNLTSEVQVTNLAPPSINASVGAEGILVLTGTVPTQSIVDFTQRLAIESYGADNVVNEIEVDDEVDVTFSLYRLPLVFPAFTPFPEWYIEIEDNVITGELLSGASYPSGQVSMTPQIEALMPVAAATLTRNPTLVMTMEGHTDNIGSVESNQALSLARAQEGKDWLVAAGIDPDRVFVVGKGESEPIADNETPEGRAMNRRVVYRLGPPE